MTLQTTPKIKRALKELIDISQLQENHNTSENELLRKVILQFDLSPLEEDFLRRHFEQAKE